MRLRDARIDEGEGRVSFRRDIHRDDPLRDADLHRRETDPAERVHRFQQVVGESPDITVHRLDRGGDVAKTGVRMMENLEHCHGADYRLRRP